MMDELKPEDMAEVVELIKSKQPKNQTVLDIVISQLKEEIVKSAHKDSSTIRTGDYRIGLTKAIEFCEQAKEMQKEQRIKNIKDYNIVVTEFLLNPLFNLEHSQHAIACEKLSDIRNKFISNHIINYNETYGGNK